VFGTPGDQPKVLALRYELGGLFAAIPLGPLQLLILSLRIAGGLGQHLAQLSLGLCGFPLGWLPCCHAQDVGMPVGELKPLVWKCRPSEIVGDCKHSHRRNDQQCRRLG